MNPNTKLDHATLAMKLPASLSVPYGGQDEMIKDLKEKVFADETFKHLAVEDGKMVVREV